MAKPNAHAPLGEGGRFAALKQKLAARGDVKNPAAVAAAIGRKKYGAKKFAAMGAHGRSHMPKGGVMSPRGDLGVLRQHEAMSVGGFKGPVMSASSRLK